MAYSNDDYNLYQFLANKQPPTDITYNQLLISATYNEEYDENVSLNVFVNNRENKSLPSKIPYYTFLFNQNHVSCLEDALVFLLAVKKKKE